MASGQLRNRRAVAIGTEVAGDKGARGITVERFCELIYAMKELNLSETRPILEKFSVRVKYITRKKKRMRSGRRFFVSNEFIMIPRG